MKNSNDNIGNRTRNLLTCSAVPQPTAPPRSPGFVIRRQRTDTITQTRRTERGVRSVMFSRPMLRSVSKNGRRNLQNNLQSKVKCVSSLEKEESRNILHKIRRQCFEEEREREMILLYNIRSQYSEERKKKTEQKLSDRPFSGQAL